MLVKEASDKDITDLKRRMQERQKQRILDRDTKQVIDIVNRHSKQVKKLHNKMEVFNK